MLSYLLFLTLPLLALALAVPPAVPTSTTSSPSAFITGTARSYDDCQALLARGNAACEPFPVWSEDPATPVRYQCINENVAVANSCFAVPYEEGGKAFA
ncbi:hypothetical protein HDU96_010239, partial [Phlyctochytrium bullatum]